MAEGHAKEYRERDFKSPALRLDFDADAVFWTAGKANLRRVSVRQPPPMRYHISTRGDCNSRQGAT